MSQNGSTPDVAWDFNEVFAILESIFEYINDEKFLNDEYKYSSHWSGVKDSPGFGLFRE